MRINKFKVGDKVNHVANAGGLFPAGIGVVTKITPCNDGKGVSYTIKCDDTGEDLEVNFKESELSYV